MIRLAYMSTLDDNVGAAERRGVVDQASVANKRNEIGGVIAFEGQRVCQILEGDNDAVERLFERIKRDSRHFGILELDRSEVDKRMFTEWGMVNRSMVDMLMYAYSVLP